MEQERDNLVSIPSQAGTLFGQEGMMLFSRKQKKSQYPLRRAPSSDTLRYSCQHFLEQSLNTLSGGHPLRTCIIAKTDKGSAGLNTLSGGHPLRTLEGKYDEEGIRESQYPLRRAPSSDFTAVIRLVTSFQGLNTLSGGHPLRTSGALLRA